MLDVEALHDGGTPPTSPRVCPSRLERVERVSLEVRLKEALGHGVNAVVHLVADNVPGAHSTTVELEAAGIPSGNVSTSPLLTKRNWGEV
jgi:hypothetical protein